MKQPEWDNNDYSRDFEWLGIDRRVMITAIDIDNWFSYHAPSPLQTLKYERLRSKAKEMALEILELTPTSADQTTAIRKLREAIMTANAAIACEGK